ncbi:hypothetical protein CYMTET_30794, partial [Cymbomonas tetramitiformis]
MNGVLMVERRGSVGQSVGPAAADEAARVGSWRSGRQAERRQAAERRGRSAERSGQPGRMTTRSAGSDRRRTTRWASLNAAPASEAVGGSARACTLAQPPAAGQGGSEVGGGGPEDGDEIDEQALSGSTQTAGAPGEAPAGVAEAGAALLGRRGRVVWPAEGTSFDGTVHSSRSSSHRRASLRPPCVEGLVDGAEDAGAGGDGGSVGGLPPVVAADVAAVGAPQSNSGTTLLEWMGWLRQGRLARMRPSLEAGITWEVIAGYILEEGVHPFHFSGQRQEQLIQMDQRLGQEVQMFASGLVASARLLEAGRGLVGSTGGQGYRRPRGRAL